MSRLTFFLGFSLVFAASGCFLPHPDDGEMSAPPAEAAPAVSAPAAAPASAAASSDPAAAKAAAEKEASSIAAAIAAAKEQVERSRRDYRVAPADLISVTVYQDADMSRKARVNADGTISLPLVGAVHIGGLTLLEAQARIEKKLETYVVSPQVSLFIEEYGNKMVFVMGEVQKPGSYPIPTESRMTLLEAISTAGGFTPVAAQDRTRVLRNVNGVSTTFNINVRDITQNGQKDKDIVLEPNDMIVVPQSFF